MKTAEAKKEGGKIQPFRQMVLELSKIWNWLAINHRYLSGNEEKKKSIWHFCIWIAKYLLILLDTKSQMYSLSSFFQSLTTTNALPKLKCGIQLFYPQFIYKFLYFHIYFYNFFILSFFLNLSGLQLILDYCLKLISWAFHLKWLLIALLCINTHKEFYFFFIQFISGI